MVSLIIGCKNLKESGVNQRKGKLRVIGGRKAVRPNWIGRLPKDGGIIIPGACAWDFFYRYPQVPGMESKVPGIGRKKGDETLKMRSGNAKVAESTISECPVLRDGNGHR